VKGVRPPDLLTTDAWGAKPPAGRIHACGRPSAIIFHHTAGHHAEIRNPANESADEFIRYAREIQAFHMGPGRGWLDSGHNYLVGRNGMIAVGRHFSFTANRAGRHVVSAHCPGKNTQIGIEHEHLHEQEMSPEQMHASARLHAWLMSRCNFGVTEVFPHGMFFPTSCPGELRRDIEQVKIRAGEILNREGRNPASWAQGVAFAVRHP
jgi:hypothetical protein